MKQTKVNKKTLNLNADGKAVLIPIGDIHYGYPTVNIKKVEEVIEHCLKKKCYVIGMGDYMESGLTSSIGDSVYRQNLNPQQQMEIIIELFKPLVKAGLLLGMHDGNHERRIFKTAGIDITKIMCRILKTPYLGYAAFHYLKVGNQRYDVYSTHGSSGAKLPYTKIKGALDIYRYVAAELILMGHVHSLDSMTAMIYSIDRRDGTIQSMKRHAVLTGHFLEYEGSYAEEHNMMPSRTGVAKIKFESEKHGLYVSI